MQYQIETATDKDAQTLDITADHGSASELQKRAFTKITWDCPRQVKASPFGGLQTKTCHTQHSRCDPSRGARAWIADLYVEPTTPMSPFYQQPLWFFDNPTDAQQTGYCPQGTVCQDRTTMEAGPYPYEPNLGTGPFAGCLSQDHVINIVHLLSYKTKKTAARGSVGVSTNVKQLSLGGKSVDIVFTAGDDIDRAANMDYIDRDVQALIGGHGSRPDGYTTNAPEARSCTSVG